jgi:16S rRNA (adenine1518-N6/adenine1519-N6)-dimethyltransferase
VNSGQQEMLRRYGIKPTKRRGQNFLIDGNMSRAIAADVMQLGDHVLELGAGAAALTLPLLDAGAKVLAVEVDRHLCKLLRTELAAYPDFQLQEDDIAKLDWAELLLKAGGSPVVAGNLPYVLTSEVLFAVADCRNQVAGAVFMVQREVAQRLVASSGNKEYGVLSVVIGSLFDVQIVRQVPPQVFWPRPDVVSAVVRLLPRADIDQWSDDEFKAFKETVKGLFNQRRKKTGTILRKKFGLGADLTDKLLQEAGIDPEWRPEDIGRGQLRALSNLMAAETSN